MESLKGEKGIRKKCRGRRRRRRWWLFGSKRVKEKQSSSPGTLRLVVILPEEDSDAQLQPIFNDMEKPKADVGSLESSLLQIIEEHNQTSIRIRDQTGWYYSFFLSINLPPYKISNSISKSLLILLSKYSTYRDSLSVWMFLVMVSHISICCISWYCIIKWF